RTEILVPLAAIQAVPIAVIAWYRLHRYAWYRYSAIVNLCLELLRQLNCEVRIEHDDIYFTYQNEKFMIEASNDSAFITIWNLHWDMVDSENIQDVENMKKAVNRTNHLVHNTVLYILYKEEKSYYILSKLQCLLMPNIPNTKVYLAAILNDFFRTKQCYSQVLDDIGKDV
ncbi:hypothetical protein DXB41_13395, partial [Segatella copri]